MSSHSHHFLHDVFPYGDRDEFVAALTPFVREGLEAGDRVCAVTSPANVDGLREALDGDAERVDFHDARSWYRQPYRTLAAYDRYVAAHARPHHRVRIIGEPVWTGRSAAGVREWTRYESALNVAFASAPAWIVCPYDCAALPDEVVAHALQTHPVALNADGSRGAAAFVEPHALFDMLDDAAAPVVPATARTVALEVFDFWKVRRFVRRESAEAGLADAAAERLVLAVNELVTNAARHGRPPVRVRIWNDDKELVCQVEDAGAGFVDRLAGCVPPASGSESGRGLWLVRQLCDSLDVLRSQSGFAVRVRVGLRPEPIAGAD